MGSVEKTASHSHSNQVLQQEPCCSKPKWLLVAFSIGGVVGILFISLSALQVFGASGSIGFIASIAGGGGLTVVSLGGGLWVMMRGCNHQRSSSSEVASEEDSSPEKIERVGKKKHREFKKKLEKREGSKDPCSKEADQVGESTKALQEQQKQDKPKEIDENSLCIFAEQGDLDIIKLLINGANLNKKNSKGWTPLLTAVHSNQLDIVRYLVKQEGIQIDAKSADGRTALHEAARNCNLDPQIIDILIEAGADVNAVDDILQQTPLHFAVANHNTAAVEKLLPLVKDIDARNINGRTPLHFAAQYQFFSDEEGDRIIAFLLERGADKTVVDKTCKMPYALLNESSSGHKERFLLLNPTGEGHVERYPSREEGIYNREIWDAAERGDLKKVQKQVKKGLVITGKDNEGRTLLQVAVLTNQKEMVRFLVTQDDIKEEINVRNKRGLTALHMAVKEDTLDPILIEILIDAGADVNARDNEGCTPLHHALKSYEDYESPMAVLYYDKYSLQDKRKSRPITKKHCLEAIAILTSKGAAINARDKCGCTPLHYAAKNYFYMGIKLLLSHGANVNARDDRRRSPLQLAAGNDTPFYDDEKHANSVIELLLENGADTTARKFDKTPFDLLQHDTHVSEEMKKRLNPESRSSSKDDQLSAVVMRGDLEGLKRLVIAGADLNRMNDQGKTPLHLAVQSKEASISFIEYLIHQDGINIDPKDYKGRTPFHCAIKAGHLSFALLLAKNGAFVDEADDSNQAALHFASGNPEATELIISLELEFKA